MANPRGVATRMLANICELTLRILDEMMDESSCTKQSRKYRGRMNKGRGKAADSNY